MFESYKYYGENPHEKIHEYVLSFFKNIWKYDEYSVDLFQEDFRPVVKKCDKRLNIPFKSIFDEIKKMSIAEQKAFCKAFEDSNKIDKICSNDTQPKYYEDIPKSIRKEIKDLFSYMYESVLNNIKTFKDGYGKLDTTYNNLFKNNGNIKLCPFCRLTDIKDDNDLYRDAYDHYLPKSLYPLSAVNFHNLVPICNTCNSYHKRNKDILYRDKKRTERRKVFYPFEGVDNGIEIKVDLPKAESGSPQKAMWTAKVSSNKGKYEEVQSWNEIFNIEERYSRKIRGKIKNWVEELGEFIYTFKKSPQHNLDEIIDIYLTTIGSENATSQAFLKKRSLKELLEKSELRKSFDDTK